jgi:hypothetical protein
VSTARPPYRKLRARGWSWSGRSRIWLGEDHLLEVHSTGFTEHYRRYFLRDIRAVVVAPTREGMWWAIGAGTVLLLCGGAAAGFYFFGASRGLEAERIAMWVFGGMFAFGALLGLAVLLQQLVLGPSCACYIETSAGRRRLGAPCRLRPADRFLAELAPIITAAQAGSL